jgi:hypothetical protein
MCQVRDVVAAFVVDKGLLVNVAARQGEQAPDKERMFKIMLQIHVLASIPQTNEDFAGKMEYLVVQHSKLRLVIVNIDKDREIGVVLAGNPEPDAIVERVRALLKKA